MSEKNTAPSTPAAELEAITAEYNTIAEANGKDKTNGFESVAKARAALKKLKKSLEAPVERAPRGMGVGAYANELLLAGQSNKDVLAAVLEKFPEAKTTSGCIAYYRTKLIKLGKLTSTRAAKPAPAEQAAA